MLAASHEIHNKIVITATILFLLSLYLVNLQDDNHPSHEALACPGPSDKSEPKLDYSSRTMLDLENGKLDGGMSIFDNSSLGFKMKYPSHWSFTIWNNKQVTFHPPPGYHGLPGVMVNVGPNYFARIIEPDKTGGSENDGEYLLKNGTAANVIPIVLSGHPAIKTEFTRLGFQGGDCPPPFRVEQSVTNIYVPNGRILYTIEYVSQYVSDDLIQNMLNSFQITK